MALLSKMCLPISQTAGSDNVPRLPRAMSLGCGPERRRAAETILGQVARERRGIPAIMLVDDSDSSDRQALMNRGEVEYFETAEAPPVITRGGEWAARRGAA